MHSARQARSGMCSPLRASLSLFPSASSPGGRRIQARGAARRVPHTRRSRKKHLRRLLQRLSIRPVAQTDGSFGQTSLQGPETSGNVLNRSLRCFLPNAAIEPLEGAYRPGIRPRVLVQRPHTRRFRRKHLRPLLRWSLPRQEFSKRLCFHGFMESDLSKAIKRLFIFSFQESISKMEQKGLSFFKKRRVLYE